MLEKVNLIRKLHTTKKIEMKTSSPLFFDFKQLVNVTFDGIAFNF